MKTFEVISQTDLPKLVNFPDEYLDRDDQYMQAVGSMCAAFGLTPSDYFNKPNWNKTILFDIKCSKLYWEFYFDKMKPSNNSGY